MAQDWSRSARMEFLVSVLVESFPSLVQGHVKVLININDPFLLHVGENDSCLDMFPRFKLSLVEILLKLFELGQLHLGLSLLLFNGEIIGCLLFGGPPPLLPTNIERKKSRD